MSKVTNPFWNSDNKDNFGSVAIEYAAGQDIILDQKFIQQECIVNQAHQLMLLKTGILSKLQVCKIIEALEELKEKDLQGKFTLKIELEDVHSNVEKYILDSLGIETGGNLRLGIARNDQIYTNIRMFLRGKVLTIMELLNNLVVATVITSEKHLLTIMPGYTHTRTSQPITYAHWLLAKCYHFLDDIENLKQSFKQVNLCPLGIFEYAGTHLPIDRNLTAKLLGFNGILTNSLYSANSRGEIEAKLLADLSLVVMHVKRTVQELILWSTNEFAMVQIDDLYSTGGTAQPNLKNPDTLEVIRANCAKIYGKFIETIVIMDTLPSGYNRDTQQTKSTIIESFEIVESMLPVFTNILNSLIINKEKMKTLSEANFSTAPDLTNQIAIKANISFREAYKVLKFIIKNGYLKKKLTELKSETLIKVAKDVLQKDIKIEQKDIEDMANVDKRLYLINSTGSPSPKECLKMIQNIKTKTQQINTDNSKVRTDINNALFKLNVEVHKLLKS